MADVLTAHQRPILRCTNPWGNIPTRDDGARSASLYGIRFRFAPTRAAWFAGYRVATSSEGYPRSRLLLAYAPLQVRAGSPCGPTRNYGRRRDGGMLMGSEDVKALGPWAGECLWSGSAGHATWRSWSIACGSSSRISGTAAETASGKPGCFWLICFFWRQAFNSAPTAFSMSIEQLHSIGTSVPGIGRSSSGCIMQ